MEKKKLNWKDVVYLNQFEKYGKAFRIDKKFILGILITLFLVTPGTNWLIPVVSRKIKQDLVWRYE